MRALLDEACFDYVSPRDKDFIAAFDAAMERGGYSSGGQIGSGYCWGRHMVVYAKKGVKARQVAARIYLREGGILLRLYLNSVGKHRAYLEAAPEYIRAPFVNDTGACGHCHNEHDGVCRFRKAYTIGATEYEKCNGVTFEFPAPDLQRLPGYLALLGEFYPGLRKTALASA